MEQPMLSGQKHLLAEYCLAGRRFFQKFFFQATFYVGSCARGLSKEPVPDSLQIWNFYT